MLPRQFSCMSRLYEDSLPGSVSPVRWLPGWIMGGTQKNVLSACVLRLVCGSCRSWSRCADLELQNIVPSSVHTESRPPVHSITHRDGRLPSWTPPPRPLDLVSTLLRFSQCPYRVPTFRTALVSAPCSAASYSSPECSSTKSPHPTSRTSASRRRTAHHRNLHHLILHHLTLHRPNPLTSYLAVPIHPPPMALWRPGSRIKKSSIKNTLKIGKASSKNGDRHRTR
jgi:hypothetical protein